MVSGARAPKLSEAKRNAEALFESRTVAEIREIESRTRKDIEGKKKQLRQLVGDSYRDLIDSADKIVGIASNCESILQNVKDIQQGFSFLAHSFTTADSLLNEKRDSLSRHEELYAVSARVRYLVDTPEVIWGFLDGQQYLDAAQRLMRAQLVHQQLHANFPKSMLAKFPLLSHQWPVVLKFKSQITSAVHTALASGTLPLHCTANALAALAALEGLDGAAALAQLLVARQAAFRQRMQGAVEGGELHGESAAGRMEAVATVLAEAASIIQATIAQVGSLFLSTSVNGGQDHSACYLQLLVREDEMDVGELLFGGHAVTTNNAGGTASAAANAPELQEWHKATKKMQELLVALPSGVVERTATQWVRELADDATKWGQALLGACVTAAQLVDVEASVRAAIVGWRVPDEDALQQVALMSGAITSGQPCSLSHAASSTLDRRFRPPHLHTPFGASTSSLLPASSISATRVSSSSGRLLPIGGGQQAFSWESVCEAVLGTSLSLWLEVFHQLFMARAKQIITDAFDAMITSTGPQLDVYMQQAAIAVNEPAGQVQSCVWPDLIDGGGVGIDVRLSDIVLSGDDQAAGRKAPNLLPWSERLGPGGLARKAQAGQGDKAFRSGVQIMRKQIDQQLQAVLQSTLLLLGGGDSSMQNTGSGLLASQGSLQPTVSGSLGQGAGARVLGGVGGSGAAVRGGAVGLGRDAARATELEPFVQARCVDMAGRLSALLQERLNAVGSAKADVTGAAAAEQALLVGRLSSALAWDSRYLPILLGPPEQWRTAAAAAITGTASGGRAPPRSLGRPSGRVLAAGSKLQAVMEQLRSTAVVAFRVWAQWAAACVCASLKTSLATDDVLTSTTTPLSWQETIIPAGGGHGAADTLDSLDDAPMTDMRFSLPACPSAATQVLLRQACDELRRAGGHTAPAEAIQVWEWELLGSCLTCFSKIINSGSTTPSSQLTTISLPPTPTVALSTLGSQLSEKGVLQLLFDVRLLRDVMAGGRPLIKEAGVQGAGVIDAQGVVLDQQDAEALAALAERRKAGTLLEQQLQDRLDPIDWATYEHHLWSSVKRHYQRCIVLYGSLTQLHKVHTEAGPGRTTGAAAGTASGPNINTALNPLAVLPVGPRFQYLPIAVPAGGNTLTGSKNRLSTTALNKLTTGDSSSSDLAVVYSFADLGMGSRATGAGVGASATSAAAATQATGMGGALGVSATNALGVLQARLGTHGAALGSLGSLLGDKAAEVTAMAQQRFDLGQLSDFGSALGNAAGGLGTGLLSSLTKGVAKK